MQNKTWQQQTNQAHTLKPRQSKHTIKQTNQNKQRNHNHT